MQLDMMTLGHFLSASAVQDAVATPGAAANEWVGVYRGCQLFAFLPYQLLISLTQVLFPMVAKARADRDLKAIKRYVEQGARVGLIACGAMVSVMVAIPGPVLSLLYTAEVAERGASTLRILGGAHGLFALMGIAMTVLASLGKERLGATISAAAVIAYLAVLQLFLGRTRFGEAQLLTTAWCVAATLGTTFIVTAIAVRHFAGAFLPWSAVARVSISAGCVVLAGALLGSEVQATLAGRFLVVGKAAVLIGVYIAALIATRELGKADLATLKSLRSKA
jgi:stage V sporulation protein B